MNQKYVMNKHPVIGYKIGTFEWKIIGDSIGACVLKLQIA